MKLWFCGVFRRSPLLLGVRSRKIQIYLDSFQQAVTTTTVFTRVIPCGSSYLYEIISDHLGHLRAIPIAGIVPGALIPQVSPWRA